MKIVDGISLGLVGRVIKYFVMKFYPSYSIDSGSMNACFGILCKKKFTWMTRKQLIDGQYEFGLNICALFFGNKIEKRKPKQGPV